MRRVVMLNVFMLGVIVLSVTGPAFLASLSATEKKSLISLIPVANVIKLFFFVANDEA